MDSINNIFFNYTKEFVDLLNTNARIYRRAENDKFDLFDIIKNEILNAILNYHKNIIEFNTYSIWYTEVFSINYLPQSLYLCIQKLMQKNITITDFLGIYKNNSNSYKDNLQIVKITKQYKFKKYNIHICKEISKFINMVKDYENNSKIYSNSKFRYILSNIYLCKYISEFILGNLVKIKLLK